MAAKDDLEFIAQRLRKLLESNINPSDFGYEVGLMIREAIRLGAFADVRFVLFRDFFNRGDPFRHSLTSAAISWLANNGPDLGLRTPAPWIVDPCALPRPSILRPHVEFLASLIEAVTKCDSTTAHDPYLEQAAKLRTMFNEHAKRFDNEPVTEELAGLAHAYWSEYPLWLNNMGLPESKQRDAQLIQNATSALDSAHRKAMLVLMTLVSHLGLDSSSISIAAMLCRELYHADFSRYFPADRKHDQWPESLGTECLKLPADQQHAIRTATTTLQKIHVLKFIADANPKSGVKSSSPDAESKEGESVRANTQKIFPKGMPTNQDICDLAVRIQTEQGSGKSMNEIAREFTGEELGQDSKAMSLLAQIRRMKTNGEIVL